MDPFDPQRLALPQSALPKAQRTKPPRPTPKGHFLKGPVPLEWLAQSARLPGRALHVGVVLWFLAGLKRSQTVRLSTVVTERLGVDRHAKSRALRLLTQAGLVTVEPQRGRAPLVTLLEAKQTP